MNIQPLKNRVHLTRIAQPAASAGGIALIASEEVTGYARVVGVGPQVDGVRVGDKVFVGPWNGMDVTMKLGEQDVCAINDCDILAVCEE